MTADATLDGRIDQIEATLREVGRKLSRTRELIGGTGAGSEAVDGRDQAGTPGFVPSPGPAIRVRPTGDGLWEARCWFANDRRGEILGGAPGPGPMAAMADLMMVINRDGSDALKDAVFSGRRPDERDTREATAAQPAGDDRDSLLVSIEWDDVCYKALAFGRDRDLLGSGLGPGVHQALEALGADLRRLGRHETARALGLRDEAVNEDADVAEPNDGPAPPVAQSDRGLRDMMGEVAAELRSIVEDAGRPIPRMFSAAIHVLGRVRDRVKSLEREVEGFLEDGNREETLADLARPDNLVALGLPIGCDDKADIDRWIYDATWVAQSAPDTASDPAVAIDAALTPYRQAVARAVDEIRTLAEGIEDNLRPLCGPGAEPFLRKFYDLADEIEQMVPHDEAVDAEADGWVEPALSSRNGAGEARRPPLLLDLPPGAEVILRVASR